MARRGAGLCTDEDTIHHGHNSGYQAINLAYHFGVSRIILLGYDMQHTGGKTHWHGDHPKSLNNAAGVANWVKNFKPLAKDLARVGIEVINCTTETALDCFKRADVRDVL